MALKLQGMIVSGDPGTTAALSQVLAELKIAAEVFSGAAEARARLLHAKYDAVLVDCDDLRGGADLLRGVRDTPSNKRAIVVAVVSGRTSMSGAFVLGADFVLSKPISAERARRNLEVARAFMVAERRRYQRHTVDVAASVNYGLGGRVEARAIDVSEGGMKVRAASPLQPNWIVLVRLAVPGHQPVETRAEVTWADAEGNAGIRFLNLPGEFLATYKEFLEEQFKAESARSGA